MREIKCKSCGGPLKDIGFGKYICEYCGSLYEDYFGNIRFIEVAQKPSQRIMAQISIPFQARDYVDSNKISDYTLSELRQQLAEGLSSYMKISVNEDPCRMATIVRGEVRVIPPDHRF